MERASKPKPKSRPQMAVAATRLPRRVLARVDRVAAEYAIGRSAAIRLIIMKATDHDARD